MESKFPSWREELASRFAPSWAGNWVEILTWWEVGERSQVGHRQGELRGLGSGNKFKLQDYGSINLKIVPILFLYLYLCLQSMTVLTFMPSGCHFAAFIIKIWNLFPYLLNLGWFYSLISPVKCSRVRLCIVHTWASRGICISALSLGTPITCHQDKTKQNSSSQMDDWVMRNM